MARDRFRSDMGSDDKKVLILYFRFLFN
jgi:hypothetical protein